MATSTNKRLQEEVQDFESLVLEIREMEHE